MSSVVAGSVTLFALPASKAVALLNVFIAQIIHVSGWVELHYSCADFTPASGYLPLTRSLAPH